MLVRDPADLGVADLSRLRQSLGRALVLSGQPFTKSAHRLKKYLQGTLLVKRKVPLWIQTDSYPQGTVRYGK